ncbi:MAG: TIGR00282 family metallophosphoesterase [Pyrinomonadaceae bacterium]
MRVLVIGDVIARPGRRVVLKHIEQLRNDHEIDIAIVNGENAAGGFSITPEIADDFFAAGIDVITSGNHIFDKADIITYIKENPRILRPYNYPEGTAGNGLYIGEINGFKIAVLNLLGRVFMPPVVDDPFHAADKAFSSIPDDHKIRIVDMHCEATSEKYAMGWFLDGKASAVVGTHTHVPTADERILDNGTAYITDIGMTGSFSGVIGMNRNDVLKRFTTFPAPRASYSKGDVWLNYLVIEIDEKTGKALAIERKRIKDNK